MESSEIENHQENEIGENRSGEQTENEITTSLLKSEFLLPIENINSGNEAERKRRVHNEVEQRRKCKINSGIDKLGHVIPACIQEKKSKTQILELALDYIAELKEKYNKVIIEGAEKARVEELEYLKRENTQLREENKRMSAMVNNMKVNSNGIQQITSRSKKSRSQKQQVFAKTIEPMTDFSADIAKLNLEMEQILANQDITVEPSTPVNQGVNQNLYDQLTQPATTQQDLEVPTARNVPHPVNIVPNLHNLNSANTDGIPNEVLLNSSADTPSASVMNSNLISVKSEESKVTNQGQMLLLDNQKLATTGGTQPVTLQVDSPSSVGQNIQILPPGNQIQLQSGIQNQAITVNKPIQQIQIAAGNNDSIKPAQTTAIQLQGNQNIIIPNQIADQSKPQLKNVIQNQQTVTIPHALNRTVSQPAPVQVPSSNGNTVIQPPIQPMQPIRLIVPIMTTATGQTSLTQQLTFRLPNGQTQTFPLRIIPATTGGTLNPSQTTTTTHASNLMPLAPAQTPPVQNTSGMIRIQPAPTTNTTTLPEIKPNTKKKKNSKTKTVTDSTNSVVQPTSTITAPGNQRMVRVQAPIQIGQKNPSGAQNLVYLQQSGQLIPIYLPANSAPGQNVQNIISGPSGVITTGTQQGGTQIVTSQSGTIQIIPQQGIQNSYNPQQQLNPGQTQIVTTSQPQPIIIPPGKETILNQGIANRAQPHTRNTILQASDQPDTLASIMASSEISDQDSGIESQDLQKSQKSISRTDAPMSPLSVLTAELGINEVESHSGEKPNDVDGSNQDILAKAAASIFSPGSLDTVDSEHDGNSLMQLEPANKNTVPQENHSSINSNRCDDQRSSLLESQTSWLSTSVEQNEPSQKPIVPSKPVETNVKSKRKEGQKKKKKRKNTTVSVEPSPQPPISEAGMTSEFLQMAEMPSEMQKSDLRSEDNQDYQQNLASNNPSTTSRYSAEALLGGIASESATQPTETCSMSSTSSTPSNSSFPSYTGSTNFVNDILSNSMSASGLPTYINDDEQDQQTSLFSPYKSSNKTSVESKPDDLISSRSDEKRKSPSTRNAAFNSPVQSMSSDILNLADSVSDTQSQSSLLQGNQENLLPEFLSPSNSESSLVSEQDPKLSSTTPSSSAAQTRPLSSWISHHSRASELASVTQQTRSQTNNQPSSTPFSIITSTARSQSPISRPNYFSQPWLTTTSTTSTTSSLAFAQSGFTSPVSSTTRSSPSLTSPQHQQPIISSVITHSTKVTGSPSRQAKSTESKISPSPRIFTKETIHRTLTMDIVEEQEEVVTKPKKHHTLPISVPDRPPISSVTDRPSVPTTAKPKSKSSKRKKKGASATAEKNPVVDTPPPNLTESLANVGKRALDKELVDKFPWLSESTDGSQEDQVNEPSGRQSTNQTTKSVTSFSVQTLSQSSKNKGNKSLKESQLSKKNIPPKAVEELPKTSTLKEKESEQTIDSNKSQFWNPTSSFGMLQTQEPVAASENVSRSSRSNNQKSTANELPYSNTSSVITSNHTTYPRYTSHQRTSSSYTPVEVARPSYAETMTTSSSNCNTLQSTEINTSASSYDPFSLPQSFSGTNTCSSNQDTVDNLPDPDMDFLSAASEPAPIFQQSSNRRMPKQPKEITSSLPSQPAPVQQSLEQSSVSKQHTSVSQTCMQPNRDFSCVKSPMQNQQSTGYNEQMPNTVLTYQPSASRSSDNVRTDFTYNQQNKLPTSSKPDFTLQNEDHTDIFDTNALDFPSLHDSPPQENSSRASSSVSSAHMFTSHGDSQQMRMDTPRFDNYQHRSSDNMPSMDREGSINLSQTNQNFYNRQSNMSNQVPQSNLKRSASEQPPHQLSSKRQSRVETTSVNQETRNHMGVPTPESLPRTPLSVDGHVSQDTGRLPTATSNANVTHQRHHSERNTHNYNNSTENYPSRTVETGHVTSRNRNKRNNQAQYYPPSQPHRSESSSLSHDHPHDLWHSLSSQRNPAMSEATPFLPNFSAPQPSHTSLLSHSDLGSTPSSSSSSISPSRRIRHPEHPTYLPGPLPSTLLSNQTTKGSREPDIHFNSMFAPRTPTLSMNALQHNFPIFPDHHAPSFNVAKGPQIPSNMSLTTHPHISPNFNFNSIFGDVGTGSNGHVDPSPLNPGLHVPHLHSNAGIPVDEHLSLRGHHIPSRHAQTFGGNPVGLNSLMRANVPPDARPPYKVSMAMHGQPHFHGASFSGIPPY